MSGTSSLADYGGMLTDYVHVSSSESCFFTVLSTEPAPPGCKIQVEALQPDGFDIYVTLPGFTYENIT